MVKQDIICLLGNDGSGKSSICEMINSEKDVNNNTIVAIERSNGLGIKFGIDPSIVDKMTLEYTFDGENFNKIMLPDQTINQEQIYWIILDCDIDIIQKRIQSRPTSDIWETRKALKYFQQRFHHLSAHFGIPLVDTTQRTLQQVYDEVLDIVRKYSNYYRYYRQMGTQILNYNQIQECDLENKLYKIINTYDMEKITDLPEYTQEFDNVDKRKLYIRWYINNNSLEIDQQKNILHIGEYELPITGIILKLVTEGESKKVYKDISGNPFTKTLAFIILKSTIYSHSMQVTGEINNLGSIRACGSQLIMEMMWRNGLKHSYRSINFNGIIVSDFIDEISPIEVIVKRYCQGTDKHSFYDILENENIVLSNSDGEYLCGPYVRFDWRNPNHISPKTKKSLNKNSYYYIYEQIVGKEEFFNKVLANKQYAIPVGDKNITEDLLTHVIDIKQTKLCVLKMFMVLQSYFFRVNLLIKDVCFMLNKNGEQFWSEINQDCMRITAIDSNQNKFDKDIWRAGGSSSREQILQKWNDFNKIFIDYFMKNKFHQTELLNYNSYFYIEEIEKLLTNTKLKIPINLQELWLAIRGKNPRSILVTMDMFNGQPVLVKSSEVCETHSNGDYWQAMEKLSIFPDILIVDLNGAFGEIDTKNRQIIKKLAQKYHVYTGGGLRSSSDVEDMLKSSVRRCVVASADDALIMKIPKERLVVEISINEQNEVLIHGRQTNTHVNIITRINQLIQIGVYVISITFVQNEGHLSGIPRQQIRDLILQIPQNIKRIYIAGGISTLDDLEYLWSFTRIVPQLGSAIWKNKLTIGNILNSMINFNNNGTVSAIIQDINGPVKGLCYMNRQSIEQTCQYRKLYRYSRKLGKVIMKGERSGDIQHIIQISLDCDSDAMLITVDSKKPFCHTGNHSCFCLQTSIKANLATLADHIKSKINDDSYTGKMQRNPQLALAKVMEEFWEVLASHRDNQVSECSDLFVHLVMYLNGIGVTMEDIFNELNARRWTPKMFIEQNEISDKKLKEIIIGITTTKYTNKTDRFAEEHLGIKILRQSGRNLCIKGEIIDRNKFFKYFDYDENIKLSLFPSKPKDMPWLLASKRVTHLITFETVVKNYPTVYTVLHEIVDPSICLALICRKGACIEPEKWTRQNKPLIAAEHVSQVTRFFELNNIDPVTYHLDRVTGSSEGYLVNTDLYLLADAIVESGRTLEENNLEIWKVIIPKGQVRIALYGRCN
ncbi:unnamed protein product [Rotaria sordida]|uniref:Phosphoribosyl-AMP cyclohydrolase domain-containing protein n=1 Tax=Rotaria sordida TaxID=392033 RepID=A0A815RYD0_9BILA|nr:unnamed protein product [Rotaria sordida]CAF4044477.1 unnamed protein product [Rotaria sordida]